MEQNELFLYSLLKDDPILLNDKELYAKITGKYVLNGQDYDAVIDEANQLVFNKKTASQDALEAILPYVGKESSDKFFYSKTILSISKSVFPQRERPSTDTSIQQDYKSCIKALLGKKLDVDDFVTNLFFLQRFFLANIPPTVAGLNTVSYFEWVKSRTCFAQCLFQDKNSEMPFTLFCGDVSGIQNFIYNIHSSKAYKSLKGRSFYLQLLVDAIIDDLLKELGLPISNIIYSSGGKFYLLLPNNAKNQTILVNLDKKIQQFLWERYHLELYVCLGWIDFRIDDHYAIHTKDKQLNGDSIEGIRDLWKAVSEKAAQKKAKKFSSIILNQYDTFFGKVRPKEDYNGDGMTICAVSGLPVKENVENQIPFSDEDPIYVQKEIKAQILLGEQLRNSKIIAFSSVPFSTSTQLMDFDYHVNLVSKLNPSYIEAKYNLLNPNSIESYIEFIEEYGSARFKHYGGHQPALNEKGHIASLEEIATIRNTDDQNLNKIAVLKMDVDNLGRLFKGLDINYAVFAAMSDLAARIDWFFSGYINSIRERDIFRNTVNIVYAGGDDLCVIGKWDSVLEFGSVVRKEFRHYIGGDETHSLSAGFVMCNPKFPITKAIDLAEKELERAKKYKVSSTKKEFTKNAISLFETTIYWQESHSKDKEWSFVQGLSDFFYTNLMNKNISKGLIYQLHTFNAIRIKGALDWYWKSAYYFARMATKYKEFKTELKGLSEAIITGKIDLKLPNGEKKITYKTTSSRLFELIIVAAKIADFRTR